MRNRRTAFISAAVLVIGAGLFGMGAFPASGAPSTDQGLSADWHKIRVASVAAAERSMTAEAGEGGETLILFAVLTDEANVDLPPAGETPGDFFLFEEQIYSDAAQTQSIGVSSVRGELGLSTITFEATFKLTGGKLRIDGSQFGQFDRGFPITGGTGQYRDAGGVFIPFELPNGSTLFLFRIIQ